MSSPPAVKTLLKILKQNRQNQPVGIYSVCSAQSYVLQASMLQAKKDNSILLVESTSNQVDQFGGYTGMTPSKFASYIKKLAKSIKLPYQRIILGGDHLGPNKWQKQPSQLAMKKAKILVRDYIKAGYLKIHLDTSMKCADDQALLKPAIAAQRAAQLCLVCEQTAKKLSIPTQPFYVIGTEVPTPGGIQTRHDNLSITKTTDLKKTIQLTQNAFAKLGLKSAWKRVIAVVVQPGVEFGNNLVIDYNRPKAKKLSRYINNFDHLVYEAHSTDYQTQQFLEQMSQDHFAILKVGPWLTYAFREAIIALSYIEKTLLSSKTHQLSQINRILEQTMIKHPQHWQNHYQGNKQKLELDRTYSYSDRIRYYWPFEKIQQSLQKLIDNLSKIPIPPTLLSQFMPTQYLHFRQGLISIKPQELILDKIMEVTQIYSKACHL